jgi:hypothetical protein
MTLAGVLNIVLLATLPRVLPGGFRAWSAPVWLLTAAGLAMTYTRGAWIGFGAGAAALLPMSRRGRLALLAGLVLTACAPTPPQPQRLEPVRPPVFRPAGFAAIDTAILTAITNRAEEAVV